MLCSASENGHVGVVDALVDAGADELGCALTHAGREDVAKLLLDRGADIHFDSDTALFNAARQGRLDMVTLLLQHGATATNVILAAAVKNGHHAIADLLRAHGAV